MSLPLIVIRNTGKELVLENKDRERILDALANMTRYHYKLANDNESQITATMLRSEATEYERIAKLFWLD